MSIGCLPAFPWSSVTCCRLTTQLGVDQLQLMPLASDVVLRRRPQCEAKPSGQVATLVLACTQNHDWFDMLSAGADQLYSALPG